MQEQGISIPEQIAGFLEQLDAAGQDPPGRRNNLIIGVVGARDRVRPEAHGVLEELRALGIAPIMLLTGDRGLPAQAVATDLPFRRDPRRVAAGAKSRFRREAA